MDMRLIVRRCGEDIGWDEIALLSKHDVELAEMRRDPGEMV